MLDFMDIRSNNPRMTQKQICNQLGFSDSTIKRYRGDIKMDCPYNRNNYTKGKPKKSPDITTENNKTVIDESSKNKIIEKRITNRLRNDIKGGNISDSHTLSSKEIACQNDRTDRHLTGKELVEQAFKDTIND